MVRKITNIAPIISDITGFKTPEHLQNKDAAVSQMTMRLLNYLFTAMCAKNLQLAVGRRKAS